MSSESDWWADPFSIDVDGTTWAVKTDKVYFIAIQGGSKLKACSASQPIQTEIVRMIRISPSKVRPTQAEALKVFLLEKTYVSVFDIPLDAKRLTRVLMKVNKPELELWDASKEYHSPCLGLVMGLKWKAFLMGVLGVEEELAAYPMSPEPGDLFNEVMA